jgi:hypothetical protein
MAKARPKTGEPRDTHQPLKIDKLPPIVHDTILALRNKTGKTWQEIEELSAEPFGDGKLGFVDWVNLPTPVRELFPGMRIPKSNLHRWYDIRVSQVMKQVLESSEHARVLAEAFAKANVEGDRDAVTNAARDQILAVLSEDASSGGKERAVKALLTLAEVMQTARANDIRERKVAADERKLAMLENREKASIEKMEAETAKMTKKAKKGVITREDINRLRERVFGLPPIKKEG